MDMIYKENLGLALTIKERSQFFLVKDGLLYRSLHSYTNHK